MKKRKLLFTMLALSLGCLSGGSEAMAQSTNNGWNAILEQTQTTSASWTALSAGSTTGMVLGAAQSGSNATYYYYITESLNFTNSNAGGSGLTIHGTVYLYIPNGLSITCEGANANGRTGAGAGIELASGNTLYIIGGAGTVNATGGNAANGGNGDNGGNANFSYDSWIQTGSGGAGGNGGGGAGAGIGTRGANGGNGGSGGSSQSPDYPGHTNGTNGNDGTGGDTAGSMGTLYVANGITVTATGGSAGTNGGNGGSRGKCAVEDSASKNYSMAGGGGGGGGGFGGAASDIGTGGPGGGGGGGGAGGSQERDDSGIFWVGAPGGQGGYNVDGNWAQNGEEASLYGDYENGTLITNNNHWDEDDFNTKHDGEAGTAGHRGGTGSASSAGTQHEGSLTYTITYHWLLPNVTTTTVQYSPSTGASVTLPQNTLDGYQWALGVYGKDCHATGDASEFTTASKEFYGGNIAATANRTIYLKDVYGNLDFYEVKSVCMLKNSGDNTQEIGDFFVADNNPHANAPKWPITVRLQDRTLYKDSHWNTICLPFGMTKDQVSASPLAGAAIKKLNTSVSGYYPSGQVNKTPYQNFDYGHPVVLFWFDDVNLDSENLVAGKPYLVKWEYGDDLVDDTSEPENSTPLHQLDFNYVTVKETTAGSWLGSGTSSGNANFVGTFSSTQLQGGNHKTLILGADDTLYYPSTDLSVAACRGFFTIPEEAANARQIVMGFGDGETTSIIATLNDKVEKVNDNVYNLNGQRLNVLQKGINIVNGKKVVIK